MDRFELLGELIGFYMKRYGYSREDAIKAVRSDLLDMLRSERALSSMRKFGIVESSEGKA